ncbi:MAG: 3-dehydroquinate synthase [Ruminococcaceae bacterium]|nr:3-dehydroquinate synthase [Oscillospiraceae bacterium]
MNKIAVNASKGYDVHIGSHLLPNIGSYIQQMHSCCTVAIISDSNVWPLYGECVTKSLTGTGYKVIHYVIPAGEESKNPQQYMAILNFLAENALTRSDLLVALGGGVVGDITGFTAATYLRGISYIQIPTSLLAMVDSSVGGKTAIDLPSGKNLVGAFYQPDIVLCDISVLETLPKPIFIDGCAEVIKYGVLFDAELFSHLETHGLSFDREYVISRCVALKADVVCADEFDKGLRQQLNLGHTIGHSIEKYSNYTVTHGQAVAIGMAIIAKCSANSGLCDQDVYASILDLLHKFSLPADCAFSAMQIADGALSDKKRLGDTIHLVLPRSIGNCFLYPISVNDLTSFIEKGK